MSVKNKVFIMQEQYFQTYSEILCNHPEIIRIEVDGRTMPKLTDFMAYLERIFEYPFTEIDMKVHKGGYLEGMTDLFCRRRGTTGFLLVIHHWLEFLRDDQDYRAFVLGSLAADILPYWQYEIRTTLLEGTGEGYCTGKAHFFPVLLLMEEEPASGKTITPGQGQPMMAMNEIQVLTGREFARDKGRILASSSMFTAIIDGRKVHCLQDFWQLVAQAFHVPSLATYSAETVTPFLKKLSWLEAKGYQLYITEVQTMKSLLALESPVAFYQVVLHFMEEILPYWTHSLPVGGQRTFTVALVDPIVPPAREHSAPTKASTALPRHWEDDPIHT